MVNNELFRWKRSEEPGREMCKKIYNRKLVSGGGDGSEDSKESHSANLFFFGYLGK